MNDDRRATPRVEVETFVKDVFSADAEAGGNGIIFRLVTSVSEGGAFVVDRLQSLDPRCTLEIPIPDDGPLAVAAEVVRRTPDGAAVRFVDLSEGDRARIGKLASARS